MSQRPTIGRIVLYQSYGTPGGEYDSKPRAAIVTEVHEPPDGGLTPAVSLAVFNPSGIFLNQHVFYDSAGAPGTWRWPPIVDQMRVTESIVE